MLIPPQGRSRQEVLSGEAQSGIAEVSDIDRSAELFLWLWDSVFGQGRKEKVTPTEGSENEISPAVPNVSARAVTGLKL